MSAKPPANEVSSSSTRSTTTTDLSEGLNENAAKDDSAQESTVDESQPSFGWTQYAEQTNGRFAMIGFVSLLLLELFTRQDFFTWIGLR